MKQRVSVITLPVEDLRVAKAFYCDGLGWAPVFDNGEVVFFQFNGMVFALWSKTAFEADTQTSVIPGGHTFALAHNVESREEVDAIMALAQSLGAAILRKPKALPWGGYSGYFADPDGHVWEIAHNPAWEISPEGHTLFRA
jgi:hypothetical protein